MPNFVLLDLIEKVSKQHNQYFQAIVMDDDYNVIKIFITEEKFYSLAQYKGQDVTDKISFVYKGNQYGAHYELYI